MEVGIETQMGQETGNRSLCRDQVGVLLTSLIDRACSACFLIEPRTTNPGIALPTMWSFPSNHLIRKCPKGFLQTNLRSHFLN